MITNHIIQKQKTQKLMAEIGGVWYIEKQLRNYNHLVDKNKVKNHKIKMMK